MTRPISCGTDADCGQDLYIQLNGLNFHYVEWGKRSAPALVLLHGLRSYARTFEPLANVLKEHFRIIALDQRGRGLSDWDPGQNYYTDQYVTDLSALVDALELERFHLLGHSLGGINALSYSSLHPERLFSVMLEDYGPGANQGGAGLERIRRELQNTPMQFRDWNEASEFWRRVSPNVTPQALQSRLHHSLRETEQGIAWRHDQAGIAQTRLSPDPARSVPDLWPAVDALACPVLLIRGKNSDYLTDDIAAEMAARNPNIVVKHIKGAGHYVHDDNPADFQNSVKTFLAEHRS